MDSQIGDPLSDYPISFIFEPSLLPESLFFFVIFRFFRFGNYTEVDVVVDADTVDTTRSCNPFAEGLNFFEGWHLADILLASLNGMEMSSERNDHLEASLRMS